MGLFGSSLPVDDDEFDWLLACFAWLDRTLGKRDQKDGFEPQLILPSDGPIMEASTASQLFDAVKRAAGLEAWHCRLERGEERREMADTGLATGLYSESSALGTFSVEGNSPVIRYDPALLKNPDALVATFAHELAHLVVHSIGIPPGGEALEEHATDCTAVYLGFGIFLANSARNFSQFSDGAMQGWRSDTSGYLSENALIAALAIFEHRFGGDRNANGALKSYLRPPHRKAVRYLEKLYPDLPKSLEQISLDDWSQ